MSYVIAFEEDGSARDVTRRYVKAPNAKTRKLRVESTKGGTRWWKQAMRLYRRSYPLDRDQVEDAELTGKEAQEEMPKNVQDFKDHPYYALERHLRRNEALHSKREVGKVSSGKGADGDKKLESIYRRRDVHTVKSADSWYRLGREIKPGEIPLKFVRPRQKLGHDIDEEDQAAEHRDVPRVGMFAGFQTSIYIPPPVVRGRIPKNIYGNLDVYVPTMIPPGAVHITHPDTMRAARLIGIDYADAVVGFEFKGRQGTAVVKGAIVASEYQEAICDIIQGFAEEMIEEELTRRGLIALKLWRRLLLRLRIKERIDGYDIEGENGDDAEEMDETFDEEEVDAEEDEGPTISASVEPLKIDIVYPPSTRRSDKADLFTDEARGLTPAQVPRGDKSISGGVQDGRGFINENTNTDTRIIADEAIEGGGFMTDDIIEDDQQAMVHGALPDPLGDDTAGGFLPAEDLEEARLLQQVYEAEAKERDAKSTVESKVLDTTMDIDQDIEKTEEDTEEAEEESDKGSLLSHDPEDEDADPDWLI